MNRALVVAVWLLCSAPVAAQGGRTVEVRVPGPALANLLGDPTERTVLVYLPPTYDRSPDRRYPVFYLLHAFGAPNRTWLGGEGSYEGLDLTAVLDSLAAVDSVSEMIVVMPDGLTRWGGSWYVDSPVSGGWETYLSEDLVRYVDGAFRTIPHRSARGVAEQSMGAYGALSLAMHRPEVLGVVFAMSPVHTENPNPLGELGARAALAADVDKIDRAPIPARVVWSKAAAFSPAPDQPAPNAVLPYREEGGRVVRIDSTWRRWVDATLGAQLDSRAAELRGSTMRIEVGTQDPLAPEVQRLSARLTDRGVHHEYAEFESGHVQGVRRRLESSMLRFSSRALAGGTAVRRERPVPGRDTEGGPAAERLSMHAQLIQHDRRRVGLDRAVPQGRIARYVPMAGFLVAAVQPRATVAPAGQGVCVGSPTAPALDHVVLAVRDLDAAAAGFARHGFRSKPGRLHANGLLNRHVKFRDGTGIELMTVRACPGTGWRRSTRHS